MTQDVRQEALALLAETAALAPDVRLGQMMAFLGFLGEDQVERSLWDIEDDELLAVLKRHRVELLARLHDTNGAAARDPASATLPEAASAVKH